MSGQHSPRAPCRWSDRTSGPGTGSVATDVVDHFHDVHGADDCGQPLNEVAGESESILASQLEDSGAAVSLSVRPSLGGLDEVDLGFPDGEGRERPAIVFQRSSERSGWATSTNPMSVGNEIQLGSATDPGALVWQQAATDGEEPASIYAVDAAEDRDLRIEVAGPDAPGPRTFGFVSRSAGTTMIVARDVTSIRDGSLDIRGHLTQGPIELDFGDLAFVVQAAAGYLEGLVGFLKGPGGG